MENKYIAFTAADYTALNKQNWNTLIGRWCARYGHMERIMSGKSFEEIPAKVPYRKGNNAEGEDPEMIYVDAKFLAMTGYSHSSSQRSS